MNKIKNRKLRVILLLPMLLLLALATSVYASKQSELEAHVDVSPAATIDCRPDVLNLKSKGKYITCFIELSAGDAKYIEISTVRLSVKGKIGFVEAELNKNLTYLDDYDYDGIQDLMVNFNRTKVENFFEDLINPNEFIFVVSGNVKTYPFSGNDTILVTKPSAIKLVRYIQIDSQELGNGKINHIESLDLSSYSTTFTHFNGYFFTTSPTLHGFSSFYFQGKIKNKFLGFTYYKPVTVLAQMDELEDCYAFDNTVHCEGKGFLIINSKLKFILDSFSFDIKDNKTTIVGGEYFSDRLSVTDVPVNQIKIKYK
jgi:hypothetical protein